MDGSLVEEGCEDLLGVGGGVFIVHGDFGSVVVFELGGAAVDLGD